MIQIDLITGFLGSGKTTFIKKYATHLMEQGIRPAIIENDFGAINVDMLLLQDLQNENCNIEMIVGSDDRTTYKRRLKAKLISMGMQGYQRVLIEPSGIFDVEEFLDVLEEEPLDRWYRIGNIIAVVDAGLEENLSRESRYLLVSQIASAGCILYSKASEKADLSDKKVYLENCLQEFQCPNGLPDMEIQCAYGNLDASQYERLEGSGYRAASYEKLWFDQQKTFRSLYYMNLGLSPETFRQIATKLFTDTSLGKITRVKGFVPNGDKWFALNVTEKECESMECSGGQDVIIVIGENLFQERIDEIFYGIHP